MTDAMGDFVAAELAPRDAKIDSLKKENAALKNNDMVHESPTQGGTSSV